MQFANPLFLIGLLGISIPVIIHLFNFRRFKKVYFTNVRFIEELKQQTQKQSKLKHLLILLARILAIACLVLAFAQPYMPLKHQIIHKSTTNAVSTYVDNSFSMEVRGSKGNLLDEAKNKALEVSAAYKPADIFQVLSSDFEGKQQRMITREEFAEQLNEIKLSPSTRSLSEIIARQRDLLSTYPSANKNIYIISDFQKSTSDFSHLKKDTSSSVYLIPVLANQSGNLFVDTIWFDNPVQQLNQQATLRVRLKNTSENEQEKIPIKLIINNNQRAVASFDCPAKGETEVSLSFNNKSEGTQQGYLEIVDYPVTYDDKFFFSFNVCKTIPVLCINEKEENPYLNNLFGKDSSFDYSTVMLKTLDYSSFGKYRLLVLNELASVSSGFLQEIKNFTDNGGSIVVIPPPQLDAEAYKGFLLAFNLGFYKSMDTVNTRIMKLETEHGLYRDVFDKIPENLDLPLVFSHYPFVFSTRSGAEAVLKLENDDPFLTAFPVGHGKFYILSTPLRTEFSNFGKHVLFVPTFYKIALLSQPFEKLYYFIGKDDPIELSNGLSKGDDVYKIRKLGEQYEFIPENRVVGSKVVFLPHDQVKEAGNYSVMDGKNEMMGIAFNYDRKESVMDFYTPDELKAEIDKAGLTNFMVLNTREKPVSMVIRELNKSVIIGCTKDHPAFGYVRELVS
ncbi:MAG: BatA domain-containing protein [Bacteroidetes bacterium]|nr:BatA domain-containing protein [Bacteroidota bacterium]